MNSASGGDDSIEPNHQEDGYQLATSSAERQYYSTAEGMLPTSASEAAAVAAAQAVAQQFMAAAAAGDMITTNGEDQGHVQNRGDSGNNNDNGGDNDDDDNGIEETERQLQLHMQEHANQMPMTTAADAASMLIAATAEMGAGSVEALAREAMDFGPHEAMDVDTGPEGVQHQHQQQQQQQHQHHHGNATPGRHQQVSYTYQADGEPGTPQTVIVLQQGKSRSKVSRACDACRRKKVSFTL
jgi:hypothetical protein